jgi:hypothetical protein
MKKIFLLILIFVCSVQFSKSQGYVIDYNFRYPDKNSRILTGITFRDTIKNVVLKQVDVSALNPFDNLPYPVSEKYSKDFGKKAYDLSGKSLKMVVPANVLARYNIQHPENVFPVAGQVLVDNRIRTDVAVLKFTFVVGTDKAPLLSYSDLWVFNPDGSELFKLTGNDCNILDADVDPSGKYLYYSFGLTVPDTVLLKGGIRIVSLADKKYYEFPGEEMTIRCFGPGDMGVFYNGQMVDGKPERWLKVFDLVNGKIYTKKYPFNEWIQIKRINHDGVLFNDGSVENYRKEFAGEDLPWKNWEKNGE